MIRILDYVRINGLHQYDVTHKQKPHRIQIMNEFVLKFQCQNTRNSVRRIMLHIFVVQMNIQNERNYK